MKNKAILKYILYSYKKLLLDKIIIKIKKTTGLRKWVKNGKTIPLPSYIKQIIVKNYASRYLLDIFVETGTYKGNMVHAMKKKFKKIYSIELDKILYQKAKKRFARNEHISIIHGDSTDQMRKLLPKIDKSCLFWLDAHYSGKGTAKGNLETPIMEELNLILNHSNLDHVILIDDARLFTGKGDYPSIEIVKKFISNCQKDWIFVIKEDIIRIHSKI